MPNYLEIKPDLLNWAVERSGLSVDDFRESVSEWLTGTKQPTLRQLEAFARRAMVPIAYLFLKEPPSEDLPVPDYRTRRKDKVRRPSPNLVETIFAMESRQDWMREYLLEAGVSPLSFVGSASVGDDSVAVAEDMRKCLALEGDWAENLATWEDALRHLRRSIEEAGILIFSNGVVGNSTNRPLDPDEFQGFVLVDKVAPLIFVNGADFKVAQMFTIAHELVHVWVGESALFDLDATIAADVEVETYCNLVAAEFLVPRRRLKSAWPENGNTNESIMELSRQFKVSAVVLARCAKDADLISGAQFFRFYDRHLGREVQTNGGGNSGGDFWRTQNLRVGKRFGRAVTNAARDGKLSYSDAYQLTNLYGRTFDKFVELLEQGDG